MDPQHVEPVAVAPATMPPQHAPATEDMHAGAQRTAPLGRRGHDLAELPVHGEPPVRTTGPAVPASVVDALRAPGRTLDSTTSARLRTGLGRDLDGVRIHTDARAAASARDLGARAWALGKDVVVGAGEPAPGTAEGDALLHHELTHVLQQPDAAIDPTTARVAGPELDHAEYQARGLRTGAPPTPVPAGTVQRAVLGTRFTHPPRAVSAYRRITATFDGADFTVFGDGVQVMQVPAQSGRPYRVRATDARACGGSPTDTYLNNPRYVGISDNGPIPEGVYRFTVTQFATFSVGEQLQMLPGGTFTDPFGASLHGGDWGLGRTPLTPVRIVPVPRGCGSTTSRSGFYLHGGIMPGSSGCIDIGNDGIARLVTLLMGHRGPVTVTVRYTAPPPSVGPLGRAIGRFTYPPKKDAGLWDRLRSAVGGED